MIDYDYFIWIAVIEDLNLLEVFKKSKKKSSFILILLHVDVNIPSKIFYM